MAQDTFYNQPVDSEEDDSLECMEPELVKDRSISRRRHLDKERAKRNSEKTLSIVLSKSGKLPDKSTPEQQLRAEQKCKNTQKKVHQKKH